MVTVLDVSLLQHFEFVFPFLFIVTAVFAILIKMKMFDQNKTWAALIAFSLAIMASFSPIVVTAINIMAPWIILLIVFIILALLAITALGPTHDDIMGVIKNEDFEFISWVLVGIIAVIGFGSFAKAVADAGGFGEAGVAASQQEAAFYATVLHPKVLGLILIMLIAFFTIQRVGARVKIKK